MGAVSRESFRRSSAVPFSRSALASPGVHVGGLRGRRHSELLCRSSECAAFATVLRGNRPRLEPWRSDSTAIRDRRNILIVGSTGSGKTTLVNAILEAVARISPSDRVITIEDTMELQCPVENYVDLRAVAGVSMLDCLRACMRLKPTRIVVGEVRGAEAHVMLKSWNTGHPGGVATIHANDALSGLVRLESLVAEATSAPAKPHCGSRRSSDLHR